MNLRERLERGVLQNKASDRGDDLGGGGKDDDAKDDKTVQLQPGPGETTDSVRGLKGTPVDDKDDDKSDDKSDDKADDKADDDDKKAAAGADAADDKSDDKADKDADISGIPKSRLDGALKRAREAEAELRKLRAEPKEPVVAAKDDDADDGTISMSQAQERLEALDVEIAKAAKDDEDEEGAKLALLIREQRELQEGIRDARDEEARSTSKNETSEEIQFDRVVTELEENIPQLNPEHEDYDDDVTQETVTLAQALRAQGRTQADAMLLAVDYMSGKLGIDKTALQDVKLKTDVAKNVDLAKKLPPDLPGVKGTASDKGGLTGGPADGVRMDDAEFDALQADEERFKILRGDIL